MTDRLRGKRALITAAGQGIGRATAEMFIAEGAEVFATDVNADLLAGLDCETFAMDVRDDASVVAGVGRANPTVLFNCAGFVHHGNVQAATDAEWDMGFDLNVKSMFRTIRAVLPGMLANGGGSIINMSSACSSIIGAPNRFIYGATKAAVIGLTKSIAVDYIKQGIRCNAICPGTVESPSWHDRVRKLGEEMGSYDAALEAFVARQPMGRVARATEIAALVTYLASDESGFTTGHPHIIDGGWSGQ
ncbi:SDR family oxidoreductase [Jannaschia pohangensis]|uniref:2-keto-3-deoxy-L-fuconate dehydrogenase n=1 Tax=Jannaschia pohangensis TaxID=390807 RepID=A0A1I3SJ32_9RHOB|nr:SDR family oxidoreductase [Jannaschia pohangensis]SFJ58430.1 2-keto-3-deoxy-L-fuconate dehydrogenase [Jannaschia pohangensis]